MIKLLIILLMLTPQVCLARGRSGGHSSTHSSRGSYRTTYSHSSGAYSAASHSRKSTQVIVGRDNHGKIARNPAAKKQFQKSHPCPATGSTSGSCKGYVIDHVKALKRGGKDDPSNMQWQTRGAAKAKDLVE